MLIYTYQQRAFGTGLPGRRGKGGVRMFKSVFSRIMVTFTVILLICILAILAVVTSGLFQESQQKKMSDLAVAGEEVAFFLKSMRVNSFVPAETILKSEAFSENLKSISSYVSADIVVVRMDGTIAVSSDGRENPAEGKEPAESLPQATVAAVIDDLGRDGDRYAVSNLDGYLEKRSLNQFVVVGDNTGDPLYLIIVTGELAGASEFAIQMTQRAVVVSIWTVFVAIVCVSFVSRRITHPIKQIREAAKEFAYGNFNARVDIQGPDEIAELGTTFNQMAGSLAKHEENRNTFLSNVSHDLRTPMTTISGFVDGMLDGTIPPEQQQHYLEIISGEVRRLSRLVNTLLEVSRLESGKNMNMTEFNLTEKARQVIISLVGKIEEKKIDVDFDGDAEDLFAFADADAIHQVLYNLLDNAVKFTDPGGTIGIRIEETGAGSGPKGHKIAVRIRNTGKGIPPEEMEHIFERFYKSDRSRGLDKTGTGLGLYIVKTILEKHGETIHAESVAGVYTEFRFTLTPAAGRKGRGQGPDDTEPQDRSAPQERRPSGSEGPTQEQQDQTGQHDHGKEGYLT